MGVCRAKCECPAAMPYWDAMRDECLTDYECDNYYTPKPESTNCPTCHHDHCDSYGRCVHGCMAGYYGEYCDMPCGINCVQAEWYHETKETCNENGVCLHGCANNTYGLHCDMKCPGMCSTSMYYCSDPYNGHCEYYYEICHNCTGLCQGMDCQYYATAGASSMFITVVMIVSTLMLTFAVIQ